MDESTGRKMDAPKISAAVKSAVKLIAEKWSFSEVCRKVSAAKPRKNSFGAC